MMQMTEQQQQQKLKEEEEEDASASEWTREKQSWLVVVEAWQSLEVSSSSSRYD